MANLDELDAKIIEALQINARQTNRELAALCHVAPSTSLERFRSLERRDLIDGYHATASLRAINRGTQALVQSRSNLHPVKRMTRLGLGSSSNPK